MPVVAELLGGARNPENYDEIGVDAVDVSFLQTDYSFGTVFPTVREFGQRDVITVTSETTGAVAIITGNWPAPLDFAETLVPETAEDWLDRAAGRSVQSVMVIGTDYQIDIDFDGEGPSLEAFIEDWGEDDFLALSPVINGDDVGGGDGDGTPGDDVLIGTNRNDDLSGLGGDDEISGRGGRDELDGGSGADVISGGAGNDDLDGGSGRDRLNGGRGDDDLDGGGDRDMLNGNAGRDRLDGGGGNDVLNGGGGRDTIVEGAGNDRMSGGGGNDRFVIDVESRGNDRILDYDPLGDAIILRFDLPNRFGNRGDRLSGEELDDYLAYLENNGSVSTFRSDGVFLETTENENSSLDIQFTRDASEEQFWESVTLILL